MAKGAIAFALFAIMISCTGNACIQDGINRDKTIILYVVMSSTTICR